MRSQPNQLGHPSRRRTDVSRAAGAASARSARAHVTPPAATDHMHGWVRFGLSLPLPADASLEMRAGYAEARNQAIHILTAQEHAA